MKFDFQFAKALPARLWNRLANAVSPVLGLVVLFSFSSAAALHAQPQIGGGTCTNATLTGNFFYLLTGAVISGGQTVAYAELGKLQADGHGVTSGSSTESINGTQQAYTFTGTYSVQPNCAGSLTIKGSNQVSTTLAFQVVNGGQSAVLAASTAGVVSAGRAYRQTSSLAGSVRCGSGSLSGSYGYLLLGAVRAGGSSVIYSDSGQLVSDGNGNVSAASFTNANGVGAATTGSGTYIVNTDCSGTARVANVNGTRNYLVEIAQDGQTVLFMSSDAGYTIAGTAEPQFSAPQQSVVNGASFLPQKLSAGSLFSIFGTGLSAQTDNAKVVPLPRTLAASQVLVNGQAVPLIYVGPGQINAQMPFEISAGVPVSVSVSSGGKVGNAVNVILSPAAPGIFAYGNNRAVVQNPDGSVNADGVSARPGDVLVGYLTGGGPVNAAGPLTTGAPSPDGISRATSDFSVLVGNAASDVSYLGLTPQFIGLYQVNFKVPGLAPGNYPLKINVNGVVSNGPVISVGQ